MEPKGRVILVTGASNGIGLAVAGALARAGASVVYAARSLDKLTAAVERVRADGASAMAVEMDVVSDASVAAAVDAVLERFGRIDVVVNNAGNGGRLGLWSSTDAAVTRAMFEVHLFGMERVTRAVLPSMLERGAGTIVNVASTVAWVPMPAASAYSAAKAAVVAFSESLRAELADRGIRVLIFAPPHTSTGAGRDWPLDLPRIFSPEEVALQFIRALRTERLRYVAGGNNMLLLLQRVSPRLAARIMRNIGLKAVAKAHSAL